ncbi:MAG: hypothetical protein Q7S58_16220 [Candidatus Binatus sp.]|uniref:hypothetical protein n=1 Tax=Candidatus Binatus sp. TaxID=2811406 RepID=UPI00271FB09C|nr:hypothetical protein [Candidatus Binatus sp.]MDO8433945.1 hypothetical protein [Candidatus Binatus sp.]
MKNYLRIAALAISIAAGACVYPPMTEPPRDEQQRVVIPLPYDLAWDAVNSMIQENGMRIQAQDSNHGIIEAVGPRFTLRDADCGKIKSVVGTYAAEPEPNSSSVYNFLVRPHGKEASVVEVRATFASPVRVPLRQTKDVDCISRGTEESNLLRQLLVVAKRTRRPTFTQPSESPPASEPTAAAIAPARPTLPTSSDNRGSGSTIGKSPAASRFSIAPGLSPLTIPGAPPASR